VDATNSLVGTLQLRGIFIMAEISGEVVDMYLSGYWSLFASMLLLIWFISVVFG